MIRVLVLAASAAFLLAPAVAYANCGAQHTAQSLAIGLDRPRREEESGTGDDRRQGRRHADGALEVAARPD